MRVVALVGGGNKMSAGCFACHKFLFIFLISNFSAPNSISSKTTIDGTRQCQHCRVPGTAREVTRLRIDR